MQQVTVTIEADGSIEIEASGYTGKSCEDTTSWLEEELGLVEDTKYKPEYYSHNYDNTQY